ncbi:hypothetical protein C0991_001729 [Blastosporella zonata]|nr:hypothetical protein C0991_001729 [Blastosporella zonata]
MDLQRSISPASEATSSEKPFSRNFFDKNNTVQRGIYFKVLFGGVFAVILVIFAVFSIFWGSLWKIPARNLDGWVIDFDGGFIGQTFAEALTSEQLSPFIGGSEGGVTWTAVPASQFPGGLDELVNAVREEQTWAAIASASSLFLFFLRFLTFLPCLVHAGATTRLQASVATPNASYDGSEAITVYGVESRNENG